MEMFSRDLAEEDSDATACASPDEMMVDTCIEALNMEITNAALERVAPVPFAPTVDTLSLTSQLLVQSLGFTGVWERLAPSVQEILIAFEAQKTVKSSNPIHKIDVLRLAHATLRIEPFERRKPFSVSTQAPCDVGLYT